MLEDSDIQRLIDVQREVFATKQELEAFTEEMRKSFSDLQTSVDKYAARAEVIFQEMIMLTNRVNRFERWAEKVAEKTGVKYE